MSREILFRGKRIDNGEWIGGAYMHHINRTLCIDEDSVKSEDKEHIILFDGFSDWNMPRRISYVHVDPTTVGQYTGLIDKNGVKIFEGDIVDYEAFGGERYRGIVKIGSYEQDGSGGEYPPRKCCGAYIERKRWLKQEWQRDEDEEYAMPDYEKTIAVDDSALIIGNIYDNPELLEQNHDQ